MASSLSYVGLWCTAISLENLEAHVSTYLGHRRASHVHLITWMLDLVNIALRLEVLASIFVRHFFIPWCHDKWGVVLRIFFSLKAGLGQIWWWCFKKKRLIFFNLKSGAVTNFRRLSPRHVVWKKSNTYTKLSSSSSSWSSVHTDVSGQSKWGVWRRRENSCEGESSQLGRRAGWWWRWSPGCFKKYSENALGDYILIRFGFKKHPWIVFSVVMLPKMSLMSRDPFGSASGHCGCSLDLVRTHASNHNQDFILWDNYHFQVGWWVLPTLTLATLSPTYSEFFSAYWWSWCCLLLLKPMLLILMLSGLGWLVVTVSSGSQCGPPYLDSLCRFNS